MQSQKSRLIFCVRSLILLLMFSVLLTGCAGPKVAKDLLVNTEVLESPLINSGYSINSDINTRINNHEKLDESLKESLRIAINKANIFEGSGASPYIINANIEVASQAPMSFGNFEGKLQVKYTVYDQRKNKILEKTIYTEAGSDEWFFSGAKRHRRARAVNIAKNVLEFTDYLKVHI
ncbi:hypothetical protein [Pseudomaricurvus sp.]|uniref:hypothetical protein n=1 Tax=Pseudomaricurvus sp. TaxID=2004510 RepID=UPI003F6D81C2